ncbi:hypothetical protein RHMOL_Rhmol12G0100300 [Rhododendron molle]|uniref:Uncharacterized protein n=1 Tax=Rhododendron molle TaxID=49168 RepID=A0ACC0LHI8_RHOML|nr:hypothetical protein RHMOL_Rhmol12G0100300 [Rhododendron molle]
MFFYDFILFFLSFSCRSLFRTEKEANCRDLLHQLKQRAVEQRSPTQVDWLKEKIDNSSLFARDGDYDLASVGR